MTSIATHVGFTGSRDVIASHIPLLQKTLAGLRDAGFTHFHHGDCLGADVIGRDLAHDLGFMIVQHPPDNDKYRAFSAADIVLPPAPYLERNKRIVLDSVRLIALPSCDERIRSGTWSTVRYYEAMFRAPVLMVHNWKRIIQDKP